MRKTWMKTTMIAVLALAPLAVACDRDGAPRLEVRTFPLEHLQPHQAEGLIGPYIYERDPGSGYMTSTAGAITVRETSDNLDQIARVLAEYDKAQPDVRLHFQLIEADGFTQSDARIEAVETELRKIFQFRGYRLAGEAFVTATESSEITQSLQGPDDMYQLQGHVYRVSPGLIRLENVELYSRETGIGLQTTVTVRPGQTLVLGSSPKEGSTATLLLTLRAEEGPSPD